VKKQKFLSLAEGEARQVEKPTGALMKTGKKTSREETIWRESPTDQAQQAGRLMKYL
jgi:hypothetical protein